MKDGKLSVRDTARLIWLHSKELFFHRLCLLCRVLGLRGLALYFLDIGVRSLRLEGMILAEYASSDDERNDLRTGCTWLVQGIDDIKNSGR